MTASQIYAWCQALAKGRQLCNKEGHRGDAETLDDIAAYLKTLASPSVAAEALQHLSDNIDGEFVENVLDGVRLNWVIKNHAVFNDFMKQDDSSTFVLSGASIHEISSPRQAIDAAMKVLP